MGRPRVRLCLGAVVVAGCAAGSPVPSLEGLSPDRGYGDQPLRVTIQGQGFIPSFRLDPDQDARRGDARGFSGRVGVGAGAVLLRDFSWVDLDQMTAWMNDGLPAGSHPAQIRDPRGQTVTLADAFVSLGPDHDAPVVRFVRPQPTFPLAPGLTVPVTVAAADVAPGSLAELRWEIRGGGVLVAARPCALLPSPAAVTCTFDAAVPSSLAAGDTFEMTVVATDRAAIPNHGRETLSLTLQPRATLGGVEPTRGGTAGGTDVVVSGSGFLPGTRVLVDGTPLAPAGGMLVDDRTISGRMPPHPAGAATLALQSPLGEDQLARAFVYGEPPAIDAILPEEGMTAGGTMVRVIGKRFDGATQVFFGDSLAQARVLASAQWVSDTEIRGTAPAGTGRTSVWVVDAALGWDRLVDGFGWSSP
jgi:IPT/TIG domain